MSSFQRGSPAIDSSPEGQGSIPFRVRIGVTGHRRLPHQEAVAATVRRRLTGFREQLAGTEFTPVVFTIISALAEGADRLVAWQALDVLGGSAELEAVLPMALSDYRRDFGSDQSNREFDELLARAQRRYEMPPVEDRDEAYERAGCYVVDRSDVLVAVWDGRNARGRGGTAEIVAYAGKDVPKLEISTTGVVKEDELTQATRALEPALSRIDEYNRELGRAQNPGHARAERSSGDTESELPVESLYKEVARWAEAHFVPADRLASRYQRWYYHLGDALFLLSALAVSAVAAQTVFGTSHPRLALIEVGLLLLVVLVLIASRYGHYHDRWFGYRSLAEAFRPGNVVALTGVHHRYDDGAEAADRGSLREPWFQRAFSEGWRERPTPAVHDADAIGIRRFLAWWIDDQISYHRTRARRCDRRQRFLTASVYALFGTTITAALLHVFEVGHHSGWTEWFEFLAIALPGFGAAVTGIREQRQFRHHARHSSRTAARLEGLRRRLDPETGLSAVQRLASETHAVIATENVDWSDVMEFQDLELAF